MSDEIKYYVKFANGWNKIHIGDPNQILCNGEWPPFDGWKGPYESPEEAAEAVNNYRIHKCQGCFSPRSRSKSVKAISIPMGGQPGYKLRGTRRG